MAKFQYYKQETEWTCGPACMRMILEALKVKKSERQLIKLLKTNKARGTWPTAFPIAAEKYHLSYAVMRNAEINDIKHFKKKGYEVIVAYYYPKEKVDHYAVVKSISKNNISFYDPWFGEKHSYGIGHFLKMWKFDEKYSNEKRWLFAVKA